MATKYPNIIDGYSQIRVVRNRIDEIIQGDHNDLRSAVLAIENTLGINPQGPFGTVVARLNDAYSNIESHVLGNPPRHQDDVIMSPERAGVIPSSILSLPYSLLSGELSTQISRILEFLNDSLMYAGSGATTFADGYSLEFSLVRNAITQIVGQLGGGTTGTTKISGAAIPSVNFPPGISVGTLRSQLVSLLNLIDSFGDPTGAGNIGAIDFLTSTGGRYSFLGTNVQDQIEEAGNFLDEAADLREKAFNAFVVSGMAVSNDGGDANIASGFIVANGRIIGFSGVILSIPDGFTSYVYAEIINGLVTVSSSTTIPTRVSNPVVILHRITKAGGVWTSSTDLRRYGMFSNDKNYLSVGKTPTSGTDGFGCDFLSLKSAVEYAKVLNLGATLIAPMKIILVSDISITSASEMEILLDVDGFEIDGCGRKITTDQDLALFKIEADNVTINDLTLESELTDFGDELCLAWVGETAVSVDGLIITNCKLTKSSPVPCTYFLRLGSIAGTNYISHSFISGNIADAYLGGIEYVTVDTDKQVLRDSIITGNNIYQETFVMTSESGINASQHCVISDNIIKGGFNTGIRLSNPAQCNVSGNLIVGYQSSITYMNSGIVVWNDDSTDNGCVISDNIIKGILSYGINCNAGAESGRFISIYDNLIDNYFKTGITPPVDMIAIMGGKTGGASTEIWAVGNKITAPGGGAIQNCSHVLENKIYGHSDITTTASAISIDVSGVYVSNNTIQNVAGIGIYVNEISDVLIANNIMIGNLNSTTGIGSIGADCMIVGNVIKNYTSNAIQSPGNNNIIVAENRIDSCQGPSIALGGGTGAIISGNRMECVLGLGTTAISGVDSYSIITKNHITNYSTVADSTISVVSGANNVVITNNHIASSSGVGIDCNNGLWHIVSNNIIGCTGTNTPGNNGISNVGPHSIVSNNSIADPNYYGIGIGGYACLVNGNFIYGPQSSGIYVIGEECTINNNYVFAGFDGYGVELFGAPYGLVANNYLYQTNDGFGIHVSDYTTLIGNYTYQTKGSSAYEISNGDNCALIGNRAVNDAGNGISVSSDYTQVNGNYVFYSDKYGISIKSNESLVNGNFLFGCGFSSGAQIDLILANDFVCMGNNITVPPHTTVIGIDMNMSDGGLCVGNRVVAGASVVGIKYTDATKYIVEGNMSRGGFAPVGFGALPLDGYNGYAA